MLHKSVKEKVHIISLRHPFYNSNMRRKEKLL